MSTARMPIRQNAIEGWWLIGRIPHQAGAHRPLCAPGLRRAAFRGRPLQQCGYFRRKDRRERRPELRRELDLPALGQTLPSGVPKIASALPRSSPKADVPLTAKTAHC